MAAKLRTTINDPRLTTASLAELEITFLFLQWEEDSWFYRWERMLGLVWTPEDLETLANQAKNQAEMAETNVQKVENASPVQESGPRLLRYPLSLLVRPELLKSLQEHALPSTDGGLFGMSHVPKDAASLYSSSKDEFLRRMGATSARPIDDFERSGADPFSQSQRPRGGFGEARPRPLGGDGGRRK